MSTAMIRALSEVNPPWVYLADIDGQEFRETLGGLRDEGSVIVELDCSRMLDPEQLFDTFAAAAKFPTYFGRNWPAFDECLADLEWLPASGYVFILRNPQRLLAHEPSERAAFWRIMAKVAAEWAEPVNLGEWWDREGIPFHVVIEMSPDNAQAENGTMVSVIGVEAALLSA
jgi:hypothetical protein